MTVSIGERCCTQLLVSTMFGITKTGSFDRWITEDFFLSGYMKRTKNSNWEVKKETGLAACVKVSLAS